MAKKTKKTSSSSEKDLKAKLKKVRAQLSAAEKSAEKWKQRATQEQKTAVGVARELTAVRRRAAKAEAAAEKWKGRAKSAASASAAPKAAAAPATAAPAPSAQAAPRQRTATPDDTWTVTALRAEARSRGVAGYSRKTKTQLLADLRG